METGGSRCLGVSANLVCAQVRNRVYAVACSSYEDERRLRASPHAAAPLGCHATPITVRCMIVDDSARFLEVATTRLHQGEVDVVGTATTFDEAIAKVELLRPDVVLVDISLGTESGFDLAGQLAGRPDPPVLVLISTRAEADYASLIAASPAVGFIPKSRLSIAALRELVG